MQAVLDVRLFTIFYEWDIAIMLNGVTCVIPCFHIDGLFRFSQVLNHSWRDVIWFEAPESTNHMSFVLDVLVEMDAVIEFALCPITNILPRSS